MKKRNTLKNELVIYQAKSGAIELKGDFNKETIWATQAQIVKLFDVDQSVVSRHIKNIFKDGEIEEKSNMQKMHNANSDKPVAGYSLDVVLGIGYRTNSKVAIEFRKWATKTLRAHIVEGYTINKSRINKNYEAFLGAVERVKILLPSNGTIDPEDTLELIKLFAGTWFSLDAYDKSSLPKSGATKKQVIFVASDINEAISELKLELIKKGEASEYFAAERVKDTVAGIVGNVFQAFGGKDLYESIEEKAAHLLYFIIKNHPFTDGNKRSGAFAFVWFLKKAKILDIKRLTPEALTALALLVAESDPKEKEKVVGLVLMLLKK
jgi:hypothetical protein